MPCGVAVYFSNQNFWTMSLMQSYYHQFYCLIAFVYIITALARGTNFLMKVNFVGYATLCWWSCLDSSQPSQWSSSSKVLQFLGWCSNELSMLRSMKLIQLYMALWTFLLLCRKEYVKSFVEKEASIQAVNAAAWNLPTRTSKVWNQVSGYQNMLLFVWSGMHVLSRVCLWLVMLCYALAYAKTQVFLFSVFHVVSLK